MDIYLRALNEDDDKDTVSQVCSSIVDVIKSVPLEAVQQCGLYIIYDILFFLIVVPLMDFTYESI